MLELGGRPVDPGIGNPGQALSLKENFDSAIFLQWRLFGNGRSFVFNNLAIMRSCMAAMERGGCSLLATLPSH